MDSIYENFPLKKMNSEEGESLKSKKRRSTTDIQKILPQNNLLKIKPKSSKSFSEMFFNRNLEENERKGSEELLTNGDENDEGKKMQSTPTSTLDDGYESCNSTPLVSGIFELITKIIHIHVLLTFI